MLSSLDIPKLWSGPIPEPRVIKCRDTVQVNLKKTPLQTLSILNVPNLYARAKFSLLIGEDLAIGLRSGEVQLWSLATLRLLAVRKKTT
jgi:hypothetical protein